MSKTSLRAGRHDTGAIGDLNPSQGCLEAKWGRASQMSVCGHMSRVLGPHKQWCLASCSAGQSAGIYFTGS